MVIGAIMNTLVPQWAKEDESEHMEDVIRSYLSLRTNINNMIEQSDLDISTTQLIKLGASGNIPIGVIPSQGKLALNPFENETKETITNKDDALSIYGRGGGSLEYDAKNFYYQDQTIIYEHGAVLLGQADGASMMAGPGLSVYKYPLINDTRSYGFFDPGTKDEPDEKEFRFAGRYGNLTLSYEVFDIDTLGEILIRLNGYVIDLAPTTGNENWRGPFTLDLRGDMINDLVSNRLEFNHTDIAGTDAEWGIRNVTLSANETRLDLTMVSLIGNREDIGGRDSHTVHVKLLAQELNTYVWPSENVTLNFTTKYPEAWTDYLNSALNGSKTNLKWSPIQSETDFRIYTSKSTNDYYVVSLEIMEVNRLYCTLANIQMTLS